MLVFVVSMLDNKKATVCLAFCRYRVACFLTMVTTAYILIMVNMPPMRDWVPEFEFSTQENLHSFLRFRSETRNSSLSLSQPTSIKSKYRLILIWSHLYDDLLQIGMNTFKNSKCFEYKCEITDNRTRLVESDVILFHVRTMSLLDVPRHRLPNQKWVFFSLEAPPYSYFNGFQFMNNIFNWTMTYREDSDIVVRYGSVTTLEKSYFNVTNLYDVWKRKSKMATWMVSHCSTSGNREKYVQILSKYMDIDTYGLCGFATCTFNETEQCLQNFSKRYLFFLAFENAVCDDYITEKFYRTLKYEMIPVVFGGGNYKKVAPPNSFIDAMDFVSPKELSSHLYRVASNYTLFSHYFDWKSKFHSNDTPDPCGLCRKIHSRSFQHTSVYDSMEKWWVQKSRCRKWE
ncbi:alpha-(1,3)-fucosyltransferase C-like [Uloborus diversus]|uniref:alpha-(1,3)-fucosyltransferase C-like n=1 Tax=Uloborus diversus TaxID=327109 RepID=UPI0024092746|nr:alpha-(1,3)-fucosyltransferase C-like [Uloborus diversus]